MSNRLGGSPFAPSWEGLRAQASAPPAPTTLDQVRKAAGAGPWGSPQGEQPAHSTDLDLLIQQVQKSETDAGRRLTREQAIDLVLASRPELQPLIEEAERSRLDKQNQLVRLDGQGMLQEAQTMLRKAEDQGLKVVGVRQELTGRLSLVTREEVEKAAAPPRSTPARPAQDLTDHIPRAAPSTWATLSAPPRRRRWIRAGPTSPPLTARASCWRGT